MKVLLTGAFGNVGFSVLEELIKKEYNITILDQKNSRNLIRAKKYKNKVEIIWGDLKNENDIKKVVRDQDIIIHTGAVIPPLADKKPDLAYKVNVEGTFNIISEAEKQNHPPKIIYTSSIAIYGDRRKNPVIKSNDSPNPNFDDSYAKQKLECEKIIKNSNLDWVILRLSYIVDPNNIKMNTIMFEMPLNTCIEICHTKDAGIALANAVDEPKVWGKVMNIAGGKECRIVYKDYLEKMMDIYGLGKDFLTEELFSNDNYHCGFMETEISQKLLFYQNHTLNDIYKEVEKNLKYKRIFMKFLKPIIKLYFKNKSPYYL
ncbi:MAG: NAD-dependent epimerase/dehydratase family protein [Bacillota bacterium]